MHSVGLVEPSLYLDVLGIKGDAELVKITWLPPSPGTRMIGCSLELQ